MSVPILILQVGLVWWLLVCALQDLRTRTVANWLTVPPFLAAVPLAWWLGGMERVGFTLLVWACLYVFWRDGAMGAADGKIATLLAAVQPASLLWGLALLWVLYGLLWLGMKPLGMNARQCSLPGVVGLFLGYVAMQVGTGWESGPVLGTLSWF